MLIDFHTHIFPDPIAARTIEGLIAGVRSIQGTGYVTSRTMNFTDGTMNGLLRSMDENGVDMSICLPIATKQSQTASINRFAETVRTKRLLSFGTLHPLQPDWEQVLEDLAARGFQGIKLHHQFQQISVDAKESVRIVKKAQELGLLVVFHAGIDIGLPPPNFASPEKIRNLLNEVDGSNLIAAHLGGWKQWDDVERCLVGTNILFDTAFIKDFIAPEQCRRIIQNHGAAKILFATDSPWEAAADTLSFLQTLGLSDDEMARICYQNAMDLLRIEAQA